MSKKQDKTYKGWPIKPNKIQRKCIDEVLSDDAYFKVLCLSRQSGKALHKDEYILTPEGKKKIKDLKIGDKVLHPHKGISTIIDKIYQPGRYVELKGTHGRSIKAHEDHLHSVDYLLRPRLFTTKQIEQYKFTNISFQKHSPIDHIERDIPPIEPYKFGQCLLADQSGNTFLNKEYQENTRRVYRNPVEHNKYHPRQRYYHIEEMIDQYLYNSLFIRSEVVRGMIDVFGKKRKDIPIPHPDDKLMEGIKKLFRSVGYKCDFRNGRLRYTETREYIKEVNDLGYQDGYCITVDRADGLYITDDYVVTHNSTLAAAHMLKCAFTAKNQIVMYVAPSFSLCGEMILKFDAISSQPYIKSVNKSSHEVILSNGSRIIFRSAEQRDRLRGISANFVVLDEAAFIDDQIIQQVIIPMLSSTGKEMLLISTPNGLDNIFHRYFENGQREQDPEAELKYKSIQGSYLDNEFANIALIEDQKTKMPKFKFRQEYLAEFAYDSECFANLNDSIWTPPNKTDEEMFVGIDIGIRHDYTFIVYMDKHYKIHKVFFRTKFTSLEQCENWVIQILRANPFKKVMIEENSFGMAVYEAVLKVFKSKVESFYTGNQKWEIVENLISLYENDQLKLIDVVELIAHFRDFSVDKTKANGKKAYRYAAKPGKHDDGVMATAIACECVRQFGHKKKIQRVWAV